LNDIATNAALAAGYDTIPYAALPHPLTHPDRLATVATFLGYAPAPPATCRVLEVGCNDGSNLIPMAVGLPGAHFAGCDLAPVPIAAGQQLVATLGLANVSLRCEDLSTLDPSLGDFDYIIAHGVYSWVPPGVRDALFALAAQRLTPHGLMFVSYNTLPGCHVRRAAWEVLNRHVEGIADPRERIGAARTLARLIADGGPTQHAADESLRAEFRAVATRSDSQLFHDDLAMVNDPLYFRDFVDHASRHGLAYLAETELYTMSGGGIGAPARQFLSTLDPLAREQYLDYVRLRRFRQSVLRRAEALPDAAMHPQRLAAMHATADGSLLRAAQAGKVHDLARDLDPAHGGGGPVRRLLDTLVERAPSTLTMGQVREVLAAAGGLARPVETLLRDAYVGGVVNLHVHPPAAVTVPGTRPVASVLARWQAGRQEELTNLLHARVRVPDPNARRLLGLLDGSRDPAALVAAMTVNWPGARRDVEGFVAHALPQFGKLGLLSG
jgi:SAM-dependent methyltransferase